MINNRPLVTCAESRLHADLIASRLRRLGIAKDKISILLSGGIPPLEAKQEHRCEVEPIASALGKMGFGAEEARAVEARMHPCGIAVVVHAANEVEATIAANVFSQSETSAIEPRDAAVAEPILPDPIIASS